MSGISNGKGGVNVWLTTRDFELFRYLFEKKVATVRQISRDIFCGCDDRTTSARLLKLFLAGYLARNAASPDISFGYAYHLTSNGLNLLVPKYPFSIDEPRLKSDAVSHDIDLVDIDARISGLKSIEGIYTENMLASCKEFSETKNFLPYKELRSDRVLVAKLMNETCYYALEFEQTAKSKARYKEKFRDYYDARDISVVLYVCSSKRFVASLMGIDQSLRDANRQLFYFTDKEDFLDKRKPVIFSNSSRDKIELK